jgi:Ca2+-transporting ATPase
MVTHHDQNNSEKFIAVKGSPEEVLRMCQYRIVDGEKHPLTEDDRIRIQAENETMAGQALRILGVAYTIVRKDEEWFGGEGELIWLGLIGMADPIRGGVQGLMRLFHRAGIDTVMITGDQSPTAYAIGKELNLSNDEGLEILDSGHLVEMEPDVLKALAGKVHVFSRVSPAHKLQIVQALQNSGKVIAMTGDGINDAPALKAANIGIAMGHTGTDVAREVADIVLEDDNLETMIIAVSQGRTIYKNIRKSIHYLLSTNLSEIMVSFATIAAGVGHPLNAMQLLWINLMSDIWPGLALSFEPPEPDVLNQPPRDPDEPIITIDGLKRMTVESAIISAGSLSAYGYGILRYGISTQATTMMFTSLTIGQLIHALSCRSEDKSMFDLNKEHLPPNKQLTIALSASLGLQVLSMVVPGIRNLLGITPINLVDGLVIGSGATIPLIINELTKSKKKRDTNDEKELHNNF